MNPYLPLWEYIPDGEPRQFGDRVYVYGSHDRPASDTFCDHKLKVWSAPVSDLNNWICHGDIFHTAPDRDHPTDTDWTDGFLYAPDVVEKDGKYYLFCYIMWGRGCVAVSDKPEGPFKLLSAYKYDLPNDKCGDGTFIDPGVLVDDDGKVYMYCGFEWSFMVQMNPADMSEVLPDTYIKDIIPLTGTPEKRGEDSFFEACSPRKIGDTYYLIYSPKIGSRLDYMTSKSPTGPFVHRGTIIDNGVDYPGGNDHGSICKIGGQWYIFYHRMTNGTIMSRRACVERIELLEDGSIPQVEMTSLGFEAALNPYRQTPAEIACVLKNGCFVTELDLFTRVIGGVKHGAVIGYKYYDFGSDFSDKTIRFFAKTRGTGCNARLRVYLDGVAPENEIGICEIGSYDGAYTAVVNSPVGRHAVFLVAEQACSGDFVGMFEGRDLFMLEQFVFAK